MEWLYSKGYKFVCYWLIFDNVQIRIYRAQRYQRFKKNFYNAEELLLQFLFRKTRLTTDYLLLYITFRMLLITSRS